MQLVADYRAGDPVRVLVARYGVCRTTVLAHLERQGVETRVNKRKLTDEQVVEIRWLRATGLSYEALGKKFGVSRSTVMKELRTR